MPTVGREADRQNTGGQINRHIDEQIDKQTCRWAYRQAHGNAFRQNNSQVDLLVSIARWAYRHTGRQIDRYIDRQTGGQTGRQMDRHIDRQTGGQAGRQACRQMDM